MRNNKAKIINLFLPALSGAAVSLAFYSEKLAFLIFFSLIPFLYSILNDFKIYKLIIYSFTLYFFSLIWTPNSVSIIADNFVIRLLISIIMIIGVSLILSLLLTLPFYIFRFDPTSKIKTAFIFPFIYIFGEWLQGSLYSLSFPWIKLGNIASPFTIFIQSASVFGTLFISLLILFINMSGALYFCFVKISQKYIFSIFSFFLTALNLLFGYFNIGIEENESKTALSAVIVQGNYPKESKRNSTPDETLQKYLDLIYSENLENADLILFPETSMHSLIYKTHNLQQALYSLCSDFNALLLSGSQYNLNDKHYNACMTVNSDKEIDAAYIKRILVPFGEYDPFDSDLFNISASDFSAGDECSLINSKNGDIGCAICFESLFSGAVSECVKNGAEVIAILTNDSWLGKKIPLYQHHSHSIMRAVENNRYVLTSTNTGISSIIDNKGRIIKRSKLNTESILSGRYYMNNKITFYTKYGDIIILPACVIILRSCIRFIFRRIYALFFKKT